MLTPALAYVLFAATPAAAPPAAAPPRLSVDAIVERVQKR
jgi:hypothetical protein